MKKIGILSDTHSYWDEKYLHYFEPCELSAETATAATCDACIPSGCVGSVRTSTC